MNEQNNKLNNYYFTFGSVHWTKDKTSLSDVWVRVVAEDYNIARCIFIVMFAIPYLPSVSQWSMQYEEKNFKEDAKRLFTGGELVCYRQDLIEDQFQTLNI